MRDELTKGIVYDIVNHQRASLLYDVKMEA